MSNENFYDAIIIHSYAKVVKGKDQCGQMITEENEGIKIEHLLFMKIDYNLFWKILIQRNR